MGLQGTSLKKDFFRFIIPAILAQVIYSLYALVDGLFVAKGVSAVALTAVNISAPYLTLIFALSLMFSIGSSTLIAIYLGEKEEHRANKVFSQNLITIIVLSAILTFIVIVFNKQVALFLGATDITMEYVQTYTRTIAIFTVFFVVSYLFEILIKTDGYPVKGTIIVSFGVIFNIFLDYLMIMKLGMGVFGAAFATGLSQLIVISLYLTHFLSKKTNMKFEKFKFNLEILVQTTKLGISSAITELSPGIIIFLFNHEIIKYLNEDALISFTIIAYISTIEVFAINGIAQGTMPLISYYHGGKNRKNKLLLLKYAMLSAIGLTIAMGAFIYGKSEFIITAFVSEKSAELIGTTSIAMKIYFISIAVLWINIILGGYFTAIEKAKESAIISLCRGFLFVALGLWLLRTIFGAETIWYAALFSEGMTAIVAVILFNRIKKREEIDIKNVRLN